MNHHATSIGLPPKQGLYDPSLERDACGIGFVADIKGRKSHDIIVKGLEILINLTHRGACGCDPNTGDGAGVLIQIPHEFFTRECSKLGINLPAPGEYGVGMVFLPVERHDRLHCEGILERIIREEGLTVLGWRDTPIDANAIGRLARASQPYIQQVFIGRSAGMSQEALDRKLYVVRKRAESEIANFGPEGEGLLLHPFVVLQDHRLQGTAAGSADRAVLQGSVRPRDPQRAVPGAPEVLDQHVSDLATGASRSASSATTVRSTRCAATSTGCTRGRRCWPPTLFGDDIQKLFPVASPGGSDSAMFDNAAELLHLSGRSLPHAMAMLIPEAWDQDPTMNPDKRAFYEYHASLMEPWDGPAAIAFTDGTVIGATLDRNGLRPARWLVTHDDLLVMASETGVLPIPPESIRAKGRLQPGKMLLADLEEGRIVPGRRDQGTLWSRQPYGQWIRGEPGPSGPASRAAALAPHRISTQSCSASALSATPKRTCVSS